MKRGVKTKLVVRVTALVLTIYFLSVSFVHQVLVNVASSIDKEQTHRVFLDKLTLNVNVSVVENTKLELPASIFSNPRATIDFTDKLNTPKQNTTKAGFSSIYPDIYPVTSQMKNIVKETTVVKSNNKIMLNLADFGKTSELHVLSESVETTIAMVTSFPKIVTLAEIDVNGGKVTILNSSRKMPVEVDRILPMNSRVSNRTLHMLKGFERKMNPIVPRTGIVNDSHRPPKDVDMTAFNHKDVINFIPPVPEYSKSDRMYKISPNITKDYLTLESSIAYTKKVLILTPIHNSGKHLLGYVRRMQSLSYPHHLISVAFGEDGSSDDTLDVAQQVASNLTMLGFARAEVFHFDIPSNQVGGSWNKIHKKQNQMKRRAHLAKARNLLLRMGLQDEDYVLWIDSDVGTLPHDVIQQLIFVDKDVVVPVCLWKNKDGIKAVYDKNTWRETSLSLKKLKKMSSDKLMLEGYDKTSRLYLSDLLGEGRIVPIDGVGGCTLLIKADCHKNGLIFPEQIYKNHVETEGLSKMAQDMGYGVFGLPFLEVYHD